jgi:hypothetical protein
VQNVSAVPHNLRTYKEQMPVLGSQGKQAMQKFSKTEYILKQLDFKCDHSSKDLLTFGAPGDGSSFFKGTTNLAISIQQLSLPRHPPPKPVLQPHIGDLLKRHLCRFWH